MAHRKLIFQQDMEESNKPTLQVSPPLIVKHKTKLELPTALHISWKSTMLESEV